MCKKNTRTNFYSCSRKILVMQLQICHWKCWWHHGLLFYCSAITGKTVLNRYYISKFNPKIQRYCGQMRRNFSLITSNRTNVQNRFWLLLSWWLKNSSIKLMCISFKIYRYVKWFPVLYLLCWCQVMLFLHCISIYIIDSGSKTIIICNIDYELYTQSKFSIICLYLDYMS